MIKINKPVVLRPEVAEQLLHFLRYASDDGCHLRWVEALHKMGGTPTECGAIVAMLKASKLKLF